MDTKDTAKRVLVIGGTGFIGSNLVRYLVSMGYLVTVYHRPESDLENLSGVEYTSILGDLSNESTIETTLTEAMDGRDVVYNLAAFGSPLKKYARLREQVNVQAAKQVACTARKIGGIRLIHVSSSTAVGYPDHNVIADETFVFNAHNDLYAYTKYLGEQEVLKEISQGLDAVIAIPCSVVGAHAMKSHQKDVFKKIARGKMKLYPSGGLCLTSVDDLVKGLVLCQEKGISGKRYILGGANITYRQYLGEIARATGGRAPFIRLPKTLLPWAGLAAELVFKLLGKESSINKQVTEMVSKKLFYSSEFSKKELGYTISDWRETLKRTVETIPL